MARLQIATTHAGARRYFTDRRGILVEIADSQFPAI